MLWNPPCSVAVQVALEMSSGSATVPVMVPSPPVSATQSTNTAAAKHGNKKQLRTEASLSSGGSDGEEDEEETQGDSGHHSRKPHDKHLAPAALRSHAKKAHSSLSSPTSAPSPAIDAPSAGDSSHIPTSASAVPAPHPQDSDSDSSHCSSHSSHSSVDSDTDADDEARHGRTIATPADPVVRKAQRKAMKKEAKVRHLPCSLI